jgi:hypothetical protein
MHIPPPPQEIMTQPRDRDRCITFSPLPGTSMTQRASFPYMMNAPVTAAEHAKVRSVTCRTVVAYQISIS